MAEAFIDEKKDRRSPSARAFGKDLFAWLQALVFALLLLVLAFIFFGRIISVEGSSMYPTLHDGDMLLLQSIGYTPKQGDIVVLTKPFASVTGPIVKRVIATGGQRVEIDYEAGLVYVDGAVLEEPYLIEAMRLPQNPAEQMRETVVPEHHVFVMGDNRNGSSDSRNAALGAVDERYILGHALFVILPFQNMKSVLS